MADVKESSSPPPSPLPPPKKLEQQLALPAGTLLPRLRREPSPDVRLAMARRLIRRKDGHTEA